MKAQKDSDVAFPPKVIAIFEGYEKLVESGMDAANMKVSDIAIAAGIGKGTVYEYFSTKEEIITKASVYEQCKELNLLYELVLKAQGFEDRLLVSLNWLGTNLRKTIGVVQLIKTKPFKAFEGNDYCSMIMEGKTGLVEDIYRLIIDSGVAEGKIRNPVDLLERDMIVSATASAILSYLIRQEIYPESTLEDAKRYAKNLLLRALSPEL